MNYCIFGHESLYLPSNADDALRLQRFADDAENLRGAGNRLSREKFLVQVLLNKRAAASALPARPGSISGENFPFH